MRNVLLALLLNLAVVGCGKKPEAVASGSAQMDTRADAWRQYMAYRHSISLDVDESRVVSIYNTTMAACQQNTADQCVILDSQLTTGRNVYATVKMRAKSEGIKRIIASLSSLGTVIHQSMTAEDLAKPIADSKWCPLWCRVPVVVPGFGISVFEGVFCSAWLSARTW